MKDAEFKRKTEKAFALLRERGLRKKNHIPLTYRLLWSVGVQKRPALFDSFGRNACFLGVYFALMYGGIMWFVSWRPQGMNPITSLISSLLAGLFYGLCMAALFRSRRKSQDLPDWEKL